MVQRDKVVFLEISITKEGMQKILIFIKKNLFIQLYSCYKTPAGIRKCLKVLVYSIFIHEKSIIESKDNLCECMCMCVCVCVLPFDFCKQDRDKAVAKLDLSLLKKCSVCAGLFGYHLGSNAPGTGTLMRPLLAGCCLDQWMFWQQTPVFLQFQSSE